jgi:hypothetical protein
MGRAEEVCAVGRHAHHQPAPFGAHDVFHVVVETHSILKHHQDGTVGQPALNLRYSVCGVLGFRAHQKALDGS